MIKSLTCIQKNSDRHDTVSVSLIKELKYKKRNIITENKTEICLHIYFFLTRYGCFIKIILII